MHTLPLTVHPTPAPWHASRCSTKVFSPKGTMKPSKHCKSSLNRTPSSKRSKKTSWHSQHMHPTTSTSADLTPHSPSLPSFLLHSLTGAVPGPGGQDNSALLQYWSLVRATACFGPVHSGDLTHYSCCPLIRQPCLLYFLINITCVVVWNWDWGVILRLWLAIEIGVLDWDWDWTFGLRLWPEIEIVDCHASYCTLHYSVPHCTPPLTTLHYTTLHYTTLHCTTLHYTGVHWWVNFLDE